MLFALHDGNEVNGAQRKKQKTGPVARASRTRFWVGSGSGENYHRKEKPRKAIARFYSGMKSGCGCVFVAHDGWA